MKGSSSRGDTTTVVGHATRRSASVGVLLGIVSSAGCGPERDDEPEPLAHRADGCTKWCTAKFECGDGPGNGVSFSTRSECIDWCATPPSDMVGFAYQSDGTDACISEYNAMADCVDALTCEAKAAHFSDIPQAERPCWPEVHTMLACAIDNPYEVDESG